MNRTIHLFKMNMSILICLLCIMEFAHAQSSQYRLNHVATKIISPNTKSTTGTFCRVFYNETIQNTDIFYGGTAFGGENGRPNDSRYSYCHMDSLLNIVGPVDTLPFNGASDYAICRGGKNYFHLSGIPFGYQITKFNESIQKVSEVQIPGMTSDHYRLNDQMMNFTNDRIVFSAAYKIDSLDEPEEYGFRIFEYDTSLNKIRDTIILGTGAIVEGGGSISFNNHNYILSMVTDNGNTNCSGVLYAFQYDTNWHYQKKISLDICGKWCQGAVYDSGRLYLVYQSTSAYRKLDNIYLGIFDTNWVPILITPITFYNPDCDSSFCCRPFISKWKNRLYIGYDIETYGTNRDWQAIATIQDVVDQTGADARMNVYNYNFGYTLLNQPDTATLYIKNTGISSLTVESAAFSGTDSSMFLNITALPMTIAANDSARIEAVFTPATIGPKTAFLAINHNGSDSISKINMYGTGAELFASVPVPVSPADHAVDIACDALLAWQAIAGVSFYQCQVSSNVKFLDPEFDQECLKEDMKISTAYHLQQGTTYYWHVRVIDKTAYTISNWSLPYSFSTTGTSGIDFHASKNPPKNAILLNHANPFARITTCTYMLAQTIPVTISIYNILGKKVAELVNETQSAGPHQISWNPRGFTGGIYIFQIKTPEDNKTIKLILP